MKRGATYLDTPTWINKNSNNDEKCFQYTATIASNHEEITRSSQRISTITPLIINVTGNECITLQKRMTGKSLRKIIH